MENKRTASSDDSQAHHHHHDLQSKKLKINYQFQETPNLPEEIIIEILARLPVKTLLKFRCVSKSWLSRISSSQFVKAHLEISTKDSNFTNHRVVFTITDPHFNLKQCSLSSLMFEPTSTDAFDLDYPMKSPHRAVWVVGSCNGLICIAINELELFLWNPATRLSAKLPPVDVGMKPGFYHLYGFGYSESSGDHKVVGIFCEFVNGGMYESTVKMYSLRTNSWKSLAGFEGGTPLDDSGKYASGKLHFATTLGFGLNFRWDIVSIDLETEAYGKVEQPNYGEGVLESTLGVLGGCICVLNNYQKICADVWVLTEYGNTDSWTKVVVVPYFNDPGRFLYSKLLCMLPSGEVLLVFGMHLVVYSPKDNSLRHPETSNLGSFLDADAYVESLVSPAAAD